jgi:hypothetical protein
MISSMSNESASVLIITGMHRSGTSLTASLLQSAGLHIGDRLLGPGPGNSKGHFENMDFFEFHKAVLRLHAIHPDGWTFQKSIDVDPAYEELAKNLISRNARDPVWGWKDPRTVLFLNFWKKLLPQANFIMVYRSPWNVIDSLFRRGTDELFYHQPDLAPKMWQHYNQTILDFYNSHESHCMLVNSENIIEYPKEWIEAVNQKFDLQFIEPNFNLYDSSLLKNQGLNDHYSSLIKHYFPEVFALHENIESNAWRPNGSIHDATWHRQIIPLSDRTCAFQNWNNFRAQERNNLILEVELQQMKEQQTNLEKELESRQNELEEIRKELYKTKEALHKLESQNALMQN